MNSILNRRDFIKAMGMGIVSVATPGFVTGSGSAARKNNKRPNIILIMSDDVSPDLYGCYGNKKVRTPNIDEMAREGVMFRTCWASALCAPTRALIMTGRYGNRTGFYHNGLQVPQKDGSNELLKYHHSFGKLLKQAGYATAIAAANGIAAVAGPRVRMAASMSIACGRVFRKLKSCRASLSLQGPGKTKQTTRLRQGIGIRGLSGTTSC